MEGFLLLAKMCMWILVYNAFISVSIYFYLNIPQFYYKTVLMTTVGRRDCFKVHFNKVFHFCYVLRHKRKEQNFLVPVWLLPIWKDKIPLHLLDIISRPRVLKLVIYTWSLSSKLHLLS